MHAALLLAVGAAALYLTIWAVAARLTFPNERAASLRWALIGAAVAGVGELVVFMPAWSWMRVDSWNWQGKALQTLVALVVVVALGVRPVLGSGTIRAWFAIRPLLWFLAVVSLARLSTYVFPGDPPEPHRLAFQLTMPGIAEEMFFRGGLLAISLRAFPASRGVSAILMSYGVVQAMFCFSHVAYPSGSGLAFDLPAIVSPLIIGTLLCGLRFSSRSVVPGIVAHNIFNAA